MNTALPHQPSVSVPLAVGLLPGQVVWPLQPLLTEAKLAKNGSRIFERMQASSRSTKWCCEFCRDQEVQFLVDTNSHNGVVEKEDGEGEEQLLE